MTPLEKIRYRPRCATSEDYRLWVQAALEALSFQDNDNVYKKMHPFCRDCTPRHAEQMRRLGKCENDSVKFRLDRDGFLEGFVDHQSPGDAGNYKDREVELQTKNRCVVGTSLLDGTQIRFNSVKEAYQFLRPELAAKAKKPGSIIYGAIRGSERSAYGYTWRYAEKENPAASSKPGCQEKISQEGEL